MSAVIFLGLFTKCFCYLPKHLNFSVCVWYCTEGWSLSVGHCVNIKERNCLHCLVQSDDTANQAEPCMTSI